MSQGPSKIKLFTAMMNTMFVPKKIDLIGDTVDLIPIKINNYKNKKVCKSVGFHLKKTILESMQP